MNYQRGSALVEIIVATVVLAICIVSIYGAMQYSLRAATVATEKIQAAFLLDGMIDELKFIRDMSWDDQIANKVDGEIYCLGSNTGDGTPTLAEKTEASPCAEIDGKFVRTVQFTSVQRDTNNGKLNNIISFGPTNANDSKTKKVAMTVAWNDARSNVGAHTISADMIVARIFSCSYNQ